MVTAGFPAPAKTTPRPRRAGQHDPILIAGGGIGGLAVALALARRGFSSEILERRPAFAEEGAGIQIGPNGTRILSELGVAEALRPHAGIPAALHVHDGATGTTLTKIPLGDWIAQRHGAPYWVAHRQDLHAALLDCVSATPLVRVSLNAAVADVQIESDGVAVRTHDDRVLHGAALIGADGLWSAVRKSLDPELAPRFAHKSAVRTVLDARRAPAALNDGNTHIWLRPRAHIVHYPVRAGREIAVVVILDDQDLSDGWGIDVMPAWLAPRISRFPAEIRELLGAAQVWRKWSLFTDAAPKRWSRGPVTLLGDAAHPVLPFLAQGGVLALEDATTLAACLDEDQSIPAALQAYERCRKHRSLRVTRASERNGQIYQLSGLSARARDIVLRAVPPARLMARYDWLYGWRAQD
jgi:salicylate hydroxylase